MRVARSMQYAKNRLNIHRREQVLDPVLFMKACLFVFLTQTMGSHLGYIKHTIITFYLIICVAVLMYIETHIHFVVCNSQSVGWEHFCNGHRFTQSSCNSITHFSPLMLYFLLNVKTHSSKSRCYSKSLKCCCQTEEL